jgi:hypothetical protein
MSYPTSTSLKSTPSLSSLSPISSDPSSTPSIEPLNIQTQTTNTQKSKNEEGIRLDEVIPVAGLAVIYLLVGTLDWFVLFDILTDCLSKALSLSLHFPAISVPVPISLPLVLPLSPPSAVTILPMNAGLLDERSGGGPALVTSCAVALAYGILYVKRHRALLSVTSSVGVEWDKPLF